MKRIIYLGILCLCTSTLFSQQTTQSSERFPHAVELSKTLTSGNEESTKNSEINPVDENTRNKSENKTILISSKREPIYTNGKTTENVKNNSEENPPTLSSSKRTSH